MNIHEVFADGISGVHITGNLIRLDLISLQPQLKSEDGQPVYNINERIIMPIEAFVQAFGVQENLINQLISAGVLKKNQTNQGEDHV